MWIFSHVQSVSAYAGWEPQLLDYEDGMQTTLSVERQMQSFSIRSFWYCTSKKEWEQLRYSSGDPQIASIDPKTGKVRLKRVGTTYICVQTKKKRYRCKLNVLPDSIRGKNAKQIQTQLQKMAKEPVTDETIIGYMNRLDQLLTRAKENGSLQRMEVDDQNPFARFYNHGRNHNRCDIPDLIRYEEILQKLRSCQKKALRHSIQEVHTDGKQLCIRFSGKLERKDLIAQIQPREGRVYSWQIEKAEIRFEIWRMNEKGVAAQQVADGVGKIRQKRSTATWKLGKELGKGRYLLRLRYGAKLQDHVIQR